MKTLQNNFTTPKQSKRLLELGVPAESADCILRHYNWADEDFKEENWENPAIINKGISPSEAIDMFLDDEYDMAMPCWSVGRLIEIYKICNPEDSLLEVVHLDLNFDLITILMTSFEAAVGVECMDFSKLEE